MICQMTALPKYMDLIAKKFNGKTYFDFEEWQHHEYSKIIKKWIDM